MLSRHADTLVWAGRYLQRAAATARMLMVTNTSQLDGRSPDEAWRDLLNVLYQGDTFRARHGGGPVRAPAANHFLVVDRDNPGSLASSVARARGNLLHVRDLIPEDLLAAVNTLHLFLADPATARQVQRTPWDVYSSILVHSYTVAGAVEEVMSRSAGYDLLIVGRSLEQAEMTCRMIDVNRGSRGEWGDVMRAVSGVESFLWRNGSGPDAVVAHLLTSTELPTSVLSSLGRAERALATSPIDGGQAPRVLGRVRSFLAFAEIPPVGSPAFGGLLDAVQSGIRDTAEALQRDIFSGDVDSELSSYEAV